MDAEVFVANLRGLLASRGLSQRDLADRIGGETDAKRLSYYRWLRRTASQGLTRCEDRNRRQLQQICDFFGIHPVERLWSPSLSQTQSLSDEYAVMLRYIVQTTTPLDGIGRMQRGVNPDGLMALIRQSYEVLIADQQLQVRLSRKPQKQEVPLERRSVEPNESKHGVDAEEMLSGKKLEDGESPEDCFVRLSLERIRDVSQKSIFGGSANILRRIGRRLPDVIRGSLPVDLNRSMTFDQAWETHIVPGLKAFYNELEGD